MENGGGVFQQDIASEGLDAFLRMLLLDNFVHADLHPGNIMVRFYKAEQPNLPNLPLHRSSKSAPPPDDQQDDVSVAQPVPSIPVPTQPLQTKSQDSHQTF